LGAIALPQQEVVAMDDISDGVRHAIGRPLMYPVAMFGKKTKRLTELVECGG
jgi:hypothetical protein